MRGLGLSIDCGESEGSELGRQGHGKVIVDILYSDSSFSKNSVGIEQSPLADDRV